MATGFFNTPYPENEPVKSYAPGTPEREEVLKMYKDLYNQKIEVPLYIGDKEVYTDQKVDMNPPHDIKHVLGQFNKADKQHVEAAIEAALKARKEWSQMSWEKTRFICD